MNYNSGVRQVAFDQYMPLTHRKSSTEKETVADILELSNSELKSELIGRSMLLKNVEE